MANRTRGEKIFIFVNLALLILVCITILLPIINMVSTSLSSNGQVSAGNVYLLPKDITFDNYEYIFSDSGFWSSLKVSIMVTVIGTTFSMIVVTMASYPLSKRGLRHRRPIMYFFIFTMMFSGGTVPMFITINALGLMNTIWALILPGVMSVYNMILVKNFMEGLPSSIFESAAIDGATDFQTFRSLTLPLCKPVLATVGLFSAVGFWNSYMGGIMYISDPNLKPLQTKLYELLQASTLVWQMTPEQQAAMGAVSGEAIQAATIVVSTIPILIVYPFLQKHFVKGIVVGTDK